MHQVTINYAGVSQTVRVESETNIMNLVQSDRVKSDPLFSYGDNVRVTAEGAEVGPNDTIHADLTINVEHKASEKG